jgi:hypothetical protein
MKRYLLVLVALLVMVVGVQGLYIVGTHLVTRSIQQKAHELKSQSINDMDFANRVRIYAYNTIIDPKVQLIPHAISPAEIAVIIGTGDCSERALLITKMLRSEGIDAHTIYGKNGVVGHMSVEYSTGKTIHRIDEEMYPNFIKWGDGISPIEYVDNPYWFSGWGDTQ